MKKFKEFVTEIRKRPTATASLGSINLKTGASKYFNLKDEWGSKSTLELWSAPKDDFTNKGEKYLVVATSGKKAIHKDGDTQVFMGSSDQWTKVTDVNVMDMEKLIDIVGKKSVRGMTYK